MDSTRPAMGGLISRRFWGCTMPLAKTFTSKSPLLTCTVRKADSSPLLMDHHQKNPPAPKARRMESHIIFLPMLPGPLSLGFLPLGLGNQGVAAALQQGLLVLNQVALDGIPIQERDESGGILASGDLGAYPGRVDKGLLYLDPFHRVLEIGQVPSQIGGHLELNALKIRLGTFSI